MRSELEIGSTLNTLLLWIMLIYLLLRWFSSYLVDFLLSCYIVIDLSSYSNYNRMFLLFYTFAGKLQVNLIIIYMGFAHVMYLSLLYVLFWTWIRYKRLPYFFLDVQKAMVTAPTTSESLWSKIPRTTMFPYRRPLTFAQSIERNSLSWNFSQNSYLVCLSLDIWDIWSPNYRRLHPYSLC